MNLGEIKIAALRLMFPNYDENIKLDNISDLTNDANLKQYMWAMPDSINRCFDRFKDERLLPEKSETITPTEGEYSATFDLSTITDLHEISRISYTDDYGVYYGNVEYQREGDTLILFRLGGEYHLIYFAEPDEIASETVDTTVIDLPVGLLRLIPYFIKADLYEEDQPELAAQAMSIFEQRLSRVRRKPSNIQTQIKEVFTINE